MILDQSKLDHELEKTVIQMEKWLTKEMKMDLINIPHPIIFMKGLWSEYFDTEISNCCL